ncbi:histidine kinase [Flaviramulus sp. BrNp1-15]|uniref:sensor histidine kinase n=1 Tax=Flaviramulus sp. BrNp1-15 TaxID=2916754 RepID=UPI001EE7D1F8|nr:histidine kinase [Flaviramulus sp. BrNp1-15]ULC58525.1 histidine kinase [Flaviramulus sp. BrNp1-15]
MFSKEFILKKIGYAILHIIFWLGVLLFYTYFFDVGSTNFTNTLYFSFFLMPITIATTYVSIYKLIPDYLIKKRYALFGLYSIYTFIISAYLVMLSIFFSLIYISNFEYNDMAPATKNIFFVITAVYCVVFIVSAFKLLKLNLKNTEQNNLLKTKILDTQLKLKEQELNYLKMQIHPHFLFNTLNTMYGFALKKADETPEMILKLSNLLDYLLYQADKPFVLLTEEIDHIKDYIELEQMRFNNTLNINFSTNKIIETQKIAPMLLLPFVENSFKHGVLQKGVLNIFIELLCNDNQIHFTVKNTSKKQKPTNSGIGLENIKKRLDLLYPDQYSLKIDNDITNYKVSLILNI